MKAVIMAGGRGTRLGTLSEQIPKPMVKIQGMPILEREIASLRYHGFTDIILTVGYLGQNIKDYFGDGSLVSPVSGNTFGVNIEYFFENEPMGNAGALFNLKDRLSNDFLLLNADSLFDVDLKRLVSFHKEKRALATVVAHPNSHPYDSTLLVADEDCKITAWLTKDGVRPQWYRNRVNAGIHVLNKKILEQEVPTGKIDLDRQLLKPLAGSGRLFCYDSTEYVKDMGTPDRLAQVERDMESGLVHSRSRCQPRRAVFLDRDGVLNKYVGYVRKPEELELLPGTAEAVRRINGAGYLAIVVTNQPVLARGEVTQEQLSQINAKLETLLGMEGAYVDAIFVCPHHPDKGFKGEIPELKIECNCRKPKPGMLLAAAGRYNLNLAECWMVGDSERDIQAGRSAGTRTALLQEEGTYSQPRTYGQDETHRCLLDFVDRRGW